MFVLCLYLAANEYPEKNLVLNCSFYMGETVMSIVKVISRMLSSWGYCVIIYKENLLLNP